MNLRLIPMCCFLYLLSYGFKLSFHQRMYSKLKQLQVFVFMWKEQLGESKNTISFYSDVPMNALDSINQIYTGACFLTNFQAL